MSDIAPGDCVKTPKGEGFVIDRLQAKSMTNPVTYYFIRLVATRKTERFNETDVEKLA